MSTSCDFTKQQNKMDKKSVFSKVRKIVKKIKNYNSSNVQSLSQQLESLQIDDTKIMNEIMNNFEKMDFTGLSEVSTMCDNMSKLTISPICSFCGFTPLKI